MEKILFSGGGYNSFSNFASFEVEYEDVLYKTSEHAYQAAAFNDQNIKQMIIDAKSAYLAKTISVEHKDKKRSDWLEVNLEIMKDIVSCKVNQHEYLQKKLRDSGDAEIIEDTDDGFWGRGEDGNGQNQLGKIWMEMKEQYT